MWTLAALGVICVAFGLGFVLGTAYGVEREMERLRRWAWKQERAARG